MSTLQISEDNISISSQEEILKIAGTNTTAQIAGKSVDTTEPTDNQILRYDAGNVQWQSEDLPTLTEINDLTAAVVWANVPDANITESSVTQHESALSITESQITDLQSYLTAETLTMTQFKAVVAASTDFADFKTRVAAL